MRKMIQSYLLGLLIVASLISACTVPVGPPVATTESVTPPETTRVVQHALGESTVPTNPQRIVALEWTYVEDLLALGMQPVGVADIEGFHDWVKIPVELGPDVVDVGHMEQKFAAARSQLEAAGKRLCVCGTIYACGIASARISNWRYQGSGTRCFG